MNAANGHGVVLRADGLGKRYGSTWALRDCDLALPEGHVVALVGPNGAGKTTLLHLAVGLATASTGEVRVLDGLAAGSPAALEGVGFVAQDSALYPNLSVEDLIHLARNLNTGFDTARARARIAEQDFPPDRKVGKLSGGQRAQVGLTLALAKRPRLLVLDEPLSSLDPLARHEFMASLMAAVAEDGISVVFSSHVVSELERVADYLVVLTGGRVQVAGEVEDLLDAHRLYTGPAVQADVLAARLPVVRELRAEAQAHLLVRTTGPHTEAPAGWEAHRVGLEEMVLAYLRKPAASAFPDPRELTGTGRQS
ncbi:MAG: ABC transporter ATP-binding protein [Streptomyces sp.]|nr:ABC transporter ATP-binding protein [Streptomyces sp.]NUS11838.1 ABC transporter ATP-binding protein [Streptomyces sp.]